MWTTFKNSNPVLPLAVHFLFVSLSCSLKSGFFWNSTLSLCSWIASLPSASCRPSMPFIFSTLSFSLGFSFSLSLASVSTSMLSWPFLPFPLALPLASATTALPPTLPAPLAGLCASALASALALALAFGSGLSGSGFTDGTTTSSTGSPLSSSPSGNLMFRKPTMATETRQGFPGGFMSFGGKSLRYLERIISKPTMMSPAHPVAIVPPFNLSHLWRIL
mmetsp:Transcript_37621/g.86908  ORF Transcript_37621/g.86908 Transcript_37621/m.86908 type:complete len:220 (+) Transcript_37621:3132-3791(+)